MKENMLQKTLLKSQTVDNIKLRSQPSGDSDFSRRISKSSIKKPTRSGILKHAHCHTRQSIISAEESIKIIELDTSTVQKEFERIRAENPKYDIDDILTKKIDFVGKTPPINLKKPANLNEQGRVLSSDFIDFEEMSIEEST